MNVHSVLVCLYERIAHIVIHIVLCFDIWTCLTFMCYVKGFLTYKYTHRHEYDLVNRGALKGVLKCIQIYIVLMIYAMPM